MKEPIKVIIARINLKEHNIFGWKMRIMQGEEDIYLINERLKSYKYILETQEKELITLNNLLNNRKGVKK